MKSSSLPFSGIIFLISISMIFSLSNCEKTPNDEKIKVNLDNITMNNYPKVDGSTSTHPLQVLIACKLLGVEYSWMPGWDDETYRIWPSFDADPEIAEFILDTIVHNGTHSSYVNLIDGNADVIIVARAASDYEIDFAESVAVELSTTAVALDAFVFIVNINNPVTSLTVREIQDIYTENITNWNEVGGPDAEINPYQRNPNSGSQELMLSLVMSGLTMLDFPEMILIGMMGPIFRITDDRNGLGYTVYFFEQFMAPNDSLKLLAVNGVVPEYKTLQKEEYIYTTEVYAAIRSDLDTASNAYHLYQWLITDEGQSVVEESGYIPYY